MMTTTKVKIEREKLKTCLTCPICNNLFERATTISECLHTFCWKCIEDKIIEEDLNTCPVCRTALGCAPLEKLRPDNSLQDLRLKLFPPKQENAQAATETNPAPSPTSKKRTKPLSSLVANSLRVSSSPKSNAAAARKSKPTIHENDRAPSESDVLVVQKPGKTVEDGPGIESSSRALPKSRLSRRRSKPSPERNGVHLESAVVNGEEPNNKILEIDPPKVCSSSKILTDNAQDRGQNSKTVPPEVDMQKKNTEEDSERFPRVTDLLKPLSCLAEAAGQSKTGKSNEQENILISDLPNAHGNEAQIAKTNELNGNSMRSNALEQVIVEQPVVSSLPSGRVVATFVPNPEADTTKASGDNPKEGCRLESRSSLPLLRTRRNRKLQVIRQKKADVPDMQGTSQNATNVEANGKAEGRSVPVWLSLIASDNQGTNAPLPQISSCYLRVKDSNLPVSYIKKYLVKKLSLSSEGEVEVSVRGQPLVSSLRLHSLLEWWMKTTPSSERVGATVGNSGKEFVMVLFYGRKSQL